MDNKKDTESLISHIEALRQTLIKCFLALGVFLPVTFFIAPKILNYLLRILINKNDITFNYFSPTEVFLLQIKIAFLVDLIVCFPYIAKQIWNFIYPALYDNEKKFIQSTVLLSSLLFCLGVVFCVFCILPLIVNFGLSFSTSQIQPIFNISNIINLTLGLCVVFGLMFQMPLVTNSLIKSGIVDYNTIASSRPYVVVILLFLSAILTPPDIISQIMLFSPTYLLFEFGLLFSKKRGQKNE